MGTLTLQELMNEIGTMTANRSDITTDRKIRALNITQDRLARKRDFEEMERVFEFDKPFANVEATDRYLTFAEIATLTGLTSWSPREVYSLRVSDGTTARMLTGYSSRRFDQIIPDPASVAAGWPSCYTRWTDRFELFPIIDKTYSWKIRAKMWPTAFVSSNLTAVSDFDHKDDLLIFGALGYIYTALQEREKANEFYQAFTRFFTEAEKEELDQPDRQIMGFPDPNQGAPPGEYWRDPFAHSDGAD